VLKVIRKKFQYNWRTYCIGAIETRNKELIAWMIDNLNPRETVYFGDVVCRHIAQQNDLDLLNWARQKGCKWISQAFYCAVGWGSVDMLDYCIEHNLPFDKNRDYCYLAEFYGKLENLEWLRNHSFQ